LAKREAELEQQRREVEEFDRREAEKEATLKKKCGKDYGRVRVGMAWTRVNQCSGPFEIVSEDTTGTVYEGVGGYVRVQGGKIVRVLFKQR
jgi:hypothetical protein